jgi:hypothetical protein
MRPLQKMVLTELAALERLAVGDPVYGWWKPLHVRYFRSDNPMADRGTPIESVAKELRILAKEGLVKRQPSAGNKDVRYRISEKGHKALELEEEATLMRSAEEIRQALGVIEASNGSYEELAGAAAALRWVLGGEPIWEVS